MLKDGVTEKESSKDLRLRHLRCQFHSGGCSSDDSNAVLLGKNWHDGSPSSHRGVPVLVRVLQTPQLVTKMHRPDRPLREDPLKAQPGPPAGHLLQLLQMAVAERAPHRRPDRHVVIRGVVLHLCARGYVNPGEIPRAEGIDRSISLPSPRGVGTPGRSCHYIRAALTSTVFGAITVRLSGAMPSHPTDPIDVGVDVHVSSRHQIRPPRPA